MNPIEEFQKRNQDFIRGMSENSPFALLSREWIGSASKFEYSYHFNALGRPIIQFPQDMVAMQELIWNVKPDLIIETGIAHGGSLIMSAAMLALLDYCDAFESGRLLDPSRPSRKVLGIDIDIREHNRAAIQAHPLANRIEMIQGSSVAPDIVSQVHARASNHDRVMVCLDSNHTHDHVLAELRAYAPMVSPGSYCIVFDTLIEDMPPDFSKDRAWGKGNNPKTAVHEFLGHGDSGFEIDRGIQAKLMITVAPDGYLRRLG